MWLLLSNLMVADSGQFNTIINEIVYGVLAFVLVVLIICLVFIMKNYSHRVDAQKNVEKSHKKLEEALSGTNDELEEIKQERDSLQEKYDELKKVKDKLYSIAYNDRLTNLPNKQSLIEMIDNTIATLRKDEKFVMVHIDLDNFKNVNDKLGHSYGDELILDVSYRIKEALDENDFLARYGSDEFIVFSQNIADVAEYDNKIKRIQKVFAYPFVISGREFFVTISAGIVVAPKDGKTTSLLMRNADLAMYEAKNMGKNTYCYYEESIGEKYAQRLELQSDITKGIENKEFDVFYQPIVYVADNKVNMYEALLRWHHPNKGLLLPGDFLSTAISTGQISLLGEIVLDKVFDTIQKEKCLISVNLCSREFYNNELISIIEKTSRNRTEVLSKLYVEIKEDVLMENIELAKSVINRLKMLGVKVVIDNFGLNLTSLTMLNSVDISMIKIDKSFLDAAMFDESYRILIEGIIKVANHLGIGSVIEGVEDATQLTLIKNVECKNAQGFYLGKPEVK